MGRPILRRFRELLLILCALCTAALAGYSIAWFATSAAPATPVHLPAGQGSLAAAFSTPTAGRRTTVRGESDTLTELDSTTSAAAIVPAHPASRASAASTSSATPTTPAVAVAGVPTQSSNTERVVEDSFAVTTSGWIIRDAATWSARYDHEAYELALHGQDNLNLSSPIPGGDYLLSVDITVTQGGAGVVFLAAKPATFYRIMVNADGFYALQLQRQDSVIDLIPWTESAALRHPAGSTQRLHIERHGNTMQFFADKQALLQWPIPDADVVNQYGFAITAQQGAATARFDNLVVERPLRP